VNLTYRLRYRLAQALAISICEPQVRLGRRRHDGRCDKCGDMVDGYAMERLDFPMDDLSAEASSKWEKLRAMLGAEYVLYCLECGVEKERQESDDDA